MLYTRRERLRRLLDFWANALGLLSLIFLFVLCCCAGIFE